MCGIIAYVGDKEIVPILLNGLKRLEYRGYDSAGICVRNGSGLNIIKKKGRISELEKNDGIKDLSGNSGIAHTRWATHGEPNEINAHPHTDIENKIAIVHNGIIENYHSLREILKKDGHIFSSETDSEIIAHLISKFYTGDLEEAVIKAISLLEGTFGLAVIHHDEDRIIAAKRGSPIVIGIGDDEMFVASDVSAILEHTRKIVYLNDNEIAVIDKDSYSVKNFSGELQDKEVHEIKWTMDQIEKKGYKHFMLKEIFEQPESIANTLRGRIADGKIRLDIDIDLDSIDRIIITACGTSWHSALIGKYLIEKITRIPVIVDYASEFRYRDPLVTSKDLVIVISQSGETADTLAALREAKHKGAKVLGLVNVVGSTIAREVDSVIYLQAGPEIGVASTKAFTTQVIDLLLLSLHIAQKKNIIDTTHMKEIVSGLTSLPSEISKILVKSDEIRELSQKFKSINNTLYLGRGLNFPVALEGALKLKEISYIHAEGYPAAEMKHGPIALIDKNMPVVFIAPKDHTYEKILSNMQEILARGGDIIVIVTEDDEKISRVTKNVIKVPAVIDELLPIVCVVPLQLIAYHIADLKGIDVDKPRNLAKSVTVE